MNTNDDKIQWHPAFDAALQIELEDEAEYLEFEPEHLLSKKPMQIDVLVKNEKDVKIKKNIGRIFRQYNIIEYKSPEVQVFEPVEALDGKEDGLYFYRKIVEQSRDYLNPGGYLMFEIGYDQGKDVSEMMTDAGFSDVCVKKDLAGNDRVVTGML